jgi:hypothetical protein
MDFVVLVQNRTVMARNVAPRDLADIVDSASLVRCVSTDNAKPVPEPIMLRPVCRLGHLPCPSNHRRVPPVGSRTGVVPVGLAHLFSPRFLWECLNLQTLSLSPAPSSSHAACGFPALRAPAHFASRVMGPIMLEWLSGLARPFHSVIVEESEFLVQPVPTPPLPAEAPALAGLH